MNEVKVRGIVKFFGIRTSPSKHVTGVLRIDQETEVCFSLYGDKVEKFYQVLDQGKEFILLGKLYDVPAEIMVDSWIIP